MRDMINFLQYCGFSAKQIISLFLLGIGWFGYYIWYIFDGRFLKYKENSVEVIKDRKLDKEYLIYRNRKIN